MGTYGLDGVLTAWMQGSLTTEQAVGQMLQLMKQLDERLKELERLTNPPRPAMKARRRRARSEGD